MTREKIIAAWPPSLMKVFATAVEFFADIVYGRKVSGKYSTDPAAIYSYMSELLLAEFPDIPHCWILRASEIAKLINIPNSDMQDIGNTIAYLRWFVDAHAHTMNDDIPSSFLDITDIEADSSSDDSATVESSSDCKCDVCVAEERPISTYDDACNFINGVISELPRFIIDFYVDKQWVCNRSNRGFIKAFMDEITHTDIDNIDIESISMKSSYMPSKKLNLYLMEMLRKIRKISNPDLRNYATSAIRSEYVTMMESRPAF